MSDNAPSIERKESHRPIERIRDDDQTPRDLKQFMSLDDDEQNPHPSPMAVLSPPIPLNFEAADIEIKPSAVEILATTCVDAITIVEDNGIQTTTVDLGEGRFKGSKIKIELYDTAPNSFHIELSGSYEQMMDFHHHSNHLHQALMTALPERVIRLETALGLDHQSLPKKKQEKQKVQSLRRGH